MRHLGICKSCGQEKKILYSLCNDCYYSQHESSVGQDRKSRRSLRKRSYTKDPGLLRTPAQRIVVWTAAACLLVMLMYPPFKQQIVIPLVRADLGRGATDYHLPFPLILPPSPVPPASSGVAPSRVPPTQSGLQRRVYRTTVVDSLGREKLEFYQYQDDRGGHLTDLKGNTVATYAAGQEEVALPPKTVYRSFLEPVMHGTFDVGRFAIQAGGVVATGFGLLVLLRRKVPIDA